MYVWNPAATTAPFGEDGEPEADSGGTPPSSWQGG
jgi:hypothetical protein